MFGSQAVAKQTHVVLLVRDRDSHLPTAANASFHSHPVPKMSAFRVLRSLTFSTPRTVSARAFSRSVHVPRLSSQLAPRAVAPASRWFSASARVMGDGTSRSLHLLLPVLLILWIQPTCLCPRDWPRSSSTNRRRTPRQRNPNSWPRSKSVVSGR